LRARNFIHSKIEENIRKKIQDDDNENEQKHKDALQLLIENSRRSEEPFSLQVIIPPLDLSEIVLFLKVEEDPGCKHQ